jgi:triosephosphate isomerase (TIM)
MNPDTEIEANNLLDLYIDKINLDNINFIIAPPAVYLKECFLKLSKLNNNKIFLSAQNISWETKGAFTGELSATSCKSVGAEFSIIGHSERRKYNQETDELIAKKFVIAVNAGLMPIICVGESKIEFDNNKTWAVLAKQLEYLKINKNLKFLIAYEPVWSIGSGASADVDYIAKVINYIKNNIFNNSDNIKILYGGSVNAANAQSIFSIANLDGVLIGGASLDIGQLIGICNNK